MKSNDRFDFLEIGETPVQAIAEAPSDPFPLAAAPLGTLGTRGLDGTALAEVRVSDPRGYLAFMDQMHSENAVSVPTMRQNTVRPGRGGLRLVEYFGERGCRAGQFNFPTGLAVDRRGIVFIADSYNHRIQRVTPGGSVAIIGERGAKAGQFLSPQAVAVDDGQAFYIVEQGNHRVQKYSAEGVLQLIFGRPGHRAGELQGPTGIAVASGTGDIYVADTGNARIQRFDCAGRFLGVIGAPGGKHRTLANPQALTIDSADNLYVAETLAHRIVRYDPLGRVVGQYGGRFGAAAAAGTIENQFYEPRALAVDGSGLLYVADGGRIGQGGRESQGRVQAIDAQTGAARTSVERPGRGVSPMVRPSGLAVARLGDGAARGELYVADTMNHRILRFVWD